MLQLVSASGGVGMVGKRNHLHLNLPGPILAPLASLISPSWFHTHNNACFLSILTSSLLNSFHLLQWCIWCLSRYTLCPYTHSDNIDKKCHYVVLTKRMHVHMHLHLFCIICSLKVTIILEGTVIIQWLWKKTTPILQLYILSTSVLCGVHVLSSGDTNFVNNLIIYNLCHSMERFCLDVHYGCTMRIWHSSEGNNSLLKKYEGEMEWFSIGYGSPGVKL